MASDCPNRGITKKLMQHFQWKQIGLFGGGWIAIAFFFSSLLYLFSILFNPGRTLYWKDIFMWQALIYALAILSPIITLFAKRFRFDRGNWWRILPIHIVVMALFLLAHTAAYSLERRIINPEAFGQESLSFVNIIRLFVRNLPLISTLYSLLLVYIYLIDSYRHLPTKFQALKEDAYSHFLYVSGSISSLLDSNRKLANGVIIRSGCYLSVAVLLFVPLCFGLLSLKLGQDINWDLQNYHLYNPYAFLYGRINFDLAPAGLQTYFNPFIDVLYYQAITSWNAKLVGFILGFLQGLNFVILYGIYKNVIKSLKPTTKTLFFLSLMGILTVGFLSEIGAALHDSLIAAFPLSSLLIITSCIPNICDKSRNATLAIFAAGIIAGLGSGLKLVVVIFATALCLSFFILPISWRSRLKFSIIFGIGVVLGLLISGGYWFYLTWHNFGNPIFPQFNHIFGGGLAITESLRDERFLPKSFFEKVFYPVIFTINPGRVSEIGYEQFNWLILYVSFFIFFGNRILSFFRGSLLNRALTSEAKFVITYFCLAYLLWLNIFGIYRYLIAIEVLIPIILFSIANYLFNSRWTLIVTLFVIGTLTLINLRGIPDWGRASWSAQAFHLETNSLGETKPAVIFLGGQPLAWLIPMLNPDVPVIQVVPNFSVSNAYWQRAGKLIADHSGKLYIILEAQSQSAIDDANKGLGNINLFVDTNSCTSFDGYLGTRKFTYRYCEVSKKQN